MHDVIQNATKRCRAREKICLLPNTNISCLEHCEHESNSPPRVNTQESKRIFRFIAVDASYFSIWTSPLALPLQQNFKVTIIPRSTALRNHVSSAWKRESQTKITTRVCNNRKLLKAEESKATLSAYVHNYVKLYQLITF